MQTISITLPRLHEAQAQVKAESSRFNVLCLGRRAGKTVLGEHLAITAALAGQRVGWFAPKYRLLLEVWRDIDIAVKPLITKRNTQERRIELMTGGLVEFWSLDNDADAGKSRSYDLVIVDEAAIVPRLVDIWQYSIRPTLSDREGVAWFLSTPNGHGGFWKLYNLGLDPTMTEWTSWQMPTAVNPHIPASEIEAMRAELPERVYQQEILAKFMDSGGGVFRGVQACIKDTNPDGHGDCIFGVDWGRDSDYTVITVLDVSKTAVIYIDRFNQIDYHTQAQRLKMLYDRFRPYSIIAESNAMGQAIIDMMQGSGMPIQPFTTTNMSKKIAVDALALAFERGEISIPNYPPLINELLSFEGTRLPSGMIRYAAAAGGHDDTVMSLLLAYSGVSSGELILW